MFRDSFLHVCWIAPAFLGLILFGGILPDGCSGHLREECQASGAGVAPEFFLLVRLDY